jgi:hypothetical protein
LVNQRNRFPARRRFLKQSAALSAGAAIPTTVVLAQSAVAKPLQSGSGASPVGGDKSTARVEAAQATKLFDRPVEGRRGGAGGDVATDATICQPRESVGGSGVTPDLAEERQAGDSK